MPFLFQKLHHWLLSAICRPRTDFTVIHLIGFSLHVTWVWNMPCFILHCMEPMHTPCYAYWVFLAETWCRLFVLGQVWEWVFCLNLVPKYDGCDLCQLLILTVAWISISHSHHPHGLFFARSDLSLEDVTALHNCNTRLRWHWSKEDLPEVMQWWVGYLMHVLYR